MIGEIVSHYRILAKLGEGGMGIVYRAEDTKLKRTVALKFLPPELTRDPEAKARFAREAQAASALDHPNVCTVYEIDETENGQLFIAMACYEGETLQERISRGPLPLDEALDIGHQIAVGLANAHEREIVHRDIKPANIFITGEGLVKIVDFGLAMLSGQIRLTQTGTTAGTVAYMSPEQIRDEAIDHRGDLWSLGALLYEMITGRLPFVGGRAQAIVYSILNDVQEPVTGLRTGVPMELERLIDRCLEKEPGARYQTAGDLASDLGRVQRLMESPRRSITAVPQRSVAVRRRPWAIAGGALAAVLALGALLVSLNVGNLRGRLLGEETEPSIRFLAVLPFENMMGDSEQEYFVEGMHEALITELSKIGALGVISRTTAMHFRETDKSIPEIARELQVDALVKGSVLRVGGRVRITAELIRGSTGEHLWAENYDRDLREVLNLLSEVARSIAGEIDVVLTPRQEERLTADRPVDPDVYELFLRGRHHLHAFTSRDALEAQGFFQQAIDADPDFALAYTGLAGAYMLYGSFGLVPPGDVFPRAREAVQRALDLDPDLGKAHAALGLVELFTWNWAAAEPELHRALEQDPNDGDALFGLSCVRIIQGHLDEAVELIKQARRFDPYSYLRNMPLWGDLILARRFEEAVEEIQRWRILTGGPGMEWFILMNAYYQLGRFDEAMEELRRSPAMRDPDWRAAMEKAYAEEGLRGAFRAQAEQYAALAERMYLGPYTVAFFFNVAGDVDRMYVWLEKVYEERHPAVYIFANPVWDPFRKDPRFQDLMTRMGIPESSWADLGSGGD